MLSEIISPISCYSFYCLPENLKITYVAYVLFLWGIQEKAKSKKRNPDQAQTKKMVITSTVHETVLVAFGRDTEQWLV